MIRASPTTIPTQLACARRLSIRVDTSVADIAASVLGVLPGTRAGRKLKETSEGIYDMAVN